MSPKLLHIKQILQSHSQGSTTTHFDFVSIHYHVLRRVFNTIQFLVISYLFNIWPSFTKSKVNYGGVSSSLLYSTPLEFRNVQHSAAQIPGSKLRRSSAGPCLDLHLLTCRTPTVPKFSLRFLTDIRSHSLSLFRFLCIPRLEGSEQHRKRGKAST